MTLTPAQIEERQKQKEEERKLERIADSCVCAVCGGGLTTPWDPDLGKIVLRCCRDRAHRGYVKDDPVLQRLLGMRALEARNNRDTSPIDREIQHHLAKKYTQKGDRTMTNETALSEYRQTGLITVESAMDVIRTTPGWGKAPANVVKRAAMVCQDYRLYPGIHLFLIAFNAGKANESWAVVQGIKATRLQASRRKPFRYTDGPRIAGEEEARSHFLDQYDPKMLYAVCRVSGTDGSSAEGWGTWPRAQTPYGTDKGNSASNMAEIRAERRALDRLCPGELPTGLDVVDESYIAAAEDQPAGRVVDQATGEIVDGEAADVPGEDDAVSVQYDGQTPVDVQPQAEAAANGNDAGQSGNPTSKGQKKPVPPKSNPKGAASFKPKTQSDLLGAALHFYGLDLRGVLDTLDITDLSQVRSLQEAWEGIVQKKGGENVTSN